eukprot:TRINITY_DN5898_c0_g2_i2.p1 TRINITY_DN5898_c0_g2~~TRINITY_DN5898_c0_g2_i2.p1  ORF type:complete len:437 (-),score=55.43 TRINITY_DN5898_c0_g2_i2:85-1395(-)
MLASRFGVLRRSWRHLSLRVVDLGEVSAPDPYKLKGDDASFIHLASGCAFGVSDGVGGWHAHGIDPSRFSDTLMHAAYERTCALWTKSQRQGVDVSSVEEFHPLDILRYASERVASASVGGSATALTATVTHGMLTVANLGDSGLIVIRPPPMQPHGGSLGGSSNRPSTRGGALASAPPRAPAVPDVPPVLVPADPEIGRPARRISPPGPYVGLYLMGLAEGSTSPAGALGMSPAMGTGAGGMSVALPEVGGGGGFVGSSGGLVAGMTLDQLKGPNCPYQLGLMSPDTADDADVYSFPLQAGDVVVAATDGLWDNVARQHVARIVVALLAYPHLLPPDAVAVAGAGRGPPLSPSHPPPSSHGNPGPPYGPPPMRFSLSAQRLAEALQRLALYVSLSETGRSPFASKMRGGDYVGGKPDDCTVVVALVDDDTVGEAI